MIFSFAIVLVKSVSRFRINEVAESMQTKTVVSGGSKGVGACPARLLIDFERDPSST